VTALRSCRGETARPSVKRRNREMDVCVFYL
jgi:hypothetical protein